MRRADRLFQIVQFLRSRRLTTAQWLAERLEVSVRTVYRDIQDLSLSGVPIEGEAGVGYMLRHKMDLPPLMFDRQELAALIVGIRFAQSWAGPEIARAADSALAKIKTALPPNIAPELPLLKVFAPAGERVGLEYLDPLNEAIRSRLKITLDYAREDGEASRRVVWPLGLFFWGKVWTLTGWCELRQDFRTFRLDRIQGLQTDGPFEPIEGRRLEDYFRWVAETYGVPAHLFDPDL